MPTRLPQLHIASPCPASWDEMDGDDRARFCHACQKHVYDLTKMPDVEIAALIERTEGRFCGRLYRRADGTMLTRDCPVGMARVKRRALIVRARAAAVLLAVFAGVGYTLAGPRPDPYAWPAAGQSRVLSTLKRWACEDQTRFAAGMISTRKRTTTP